MMIKSTLGRILPLILALILTVSQLTSCLYLFGADFDTDAGEVEGDGSKDSSGGSSEGTDGTDEGGDLPEFLPKDDEDLDSSAITQPTRALLSVVRIVSNFEKKTNYSTTPFKSEGSGVIYSLDREAGDAYIVTNYHVVYNNTATPNKISRDIDLYLYGQENEKYKIDATFIGGALTQDLAVLRVEDSEVLKNSYAVAATLGDSDSLRVLDEVIVIGNPDGLGISATTGIVSVDSESLSMVGADGQSAIDLRVTRVSAAINQGNSGGGLFDSKGNLVGIVNAKRINESYEEDIDNFGYALPINAVRVVADSIIHYCNGTDITLYRCLLGINLKAGVMGLEIDPETGVITKVERVEVSSISSGSILEGKVGVGDVISSITVDGKVTNVSRTYHIIDAMYEARVGSTVSLAITRGDIKLTVEVTVPERALVAVK